MVGNNYRLLLFALLLFVLPGSAHAFCDYDLAEASMLEEQGNGSQAFSVYESAVKTDRRCLGAWVALGRLHGASGRWRDAEKALQKAVRLDPGDFSLSLRLAEAFLAQKKGAWALRTLKRIDPQKLKEDRVHWDYLMGLAALQQQDPTTAIEHFDAIPSEKRASYPLLQFHLGEAYLDKDESIEARRRFDGFLSQAKRPVAFDEPARIMLDSTYSGAGQSPTISLYLSLKSHYDSNVVQEPDDQPLSDGKSPDAFGLTLSGGLSYYPLRLSRHELGVDLSAVRTFYFKDPANDFSYTGGSIGPRYRFRFHSSGMDQQLNLGYSGIVGLLDGGSLAEEADIYVYNESHGGWAKWEGREEGFGDTTVNLAFSRNLYHLMGRDNWRVSMNLGQSFFLMDQQLKLFVQINARFEDARRDDYDRWGLGPFLGVSAILPWEISAAFWLRYEYLDNFRSDDTLNWEGARRDHMIRSAVSLSRSFFDALDVGVAYEATRNQSSLAIFEYARHSIQLQLTGRYSW